MAICRFHCVVDHVNNYVLIIQEAVTLCTLGIGAAFGESILNDTPRHSTVVTREYCELLRVEQKDFKILWEVRQILQSTSCGRLPAVVGY